VSVRGKVSVCTTSWDDGHPLDHRIAELLAKYGLTGTFYIPLENSRPVMTKYEIRRLGDTFEVGAHTVHHAILTDVSNTMAEEEICESKKRLEDVTGHTCEAFCFPKGRFRRGHLEMVRRAGFRCARTVELLSTRFPSHRAGISLVPTTVQSAPNTWRAYAKNCAKRFAAGNMVNFILYARSRHWTETAHSLLQAVARRGGVFHLWGHSWEIEASEQWRQLEEVLREMRGLQSSMPCVTNSKFA
jgi:peptidoglycan-N-acetylglucosamine deacetylase